MLEIAYLGLEIVIQEYVGRLDIAVNDPRITWKKKPSPGIAPSHTTTTPIS